MTSLEELKELFEDLEKASDKSQAQLLQGFFKTGKGEYGEGDIFLGIKVPVLREISKKYRFGLKEIQELLNSKIHEYRMIGLFMLVEKYKRADAKDKKKIFDFYLLNTRNINNWDLVDLSAPNIVGDYLRINRKEKRILFSLAKSKSLWERRIAVLATFAFIKNNEFIDSIQIAEHLLKDKHDLIHKAVGWMLREIGKRDERVLKDFLDRHSKIMPRTMLRYSLEKLDDEDRENYMGR